MLLCRRVNPWESVTLKLKLSDRAVEQPAKAQALKAAGLKTAATFPLRLNAFPAGLLEVLPPCLTPFLSPSCHVVLYTIVRSVSERS